MVVPTIEFLSLCDVSCMVEPTRFQFGNWKPPKLKRVCFDVKSYQDSSCESCDPGSDVISIPFNY